MSWSAMAGCIDLVRRGRMVALKVPAPIRGTDLDAWTDVYLAGSAEAALNGFLRSHKVLTVDSRWVDQDNLPECSPKAADPLWLSQDAER